MRPGYAFVRPSAAFLDTGFEASEAIAVRYCSLVGGLASESATDGVAGV